MLNSTKTWQEEFDKIKLIDNNGDLKKTEIANKLNEILESYRIKIKQFISDLRKKDEEELIKRFNFTHDSFASEREEIIRDYYEN